MKQKNIFTRALRSVKSNTRRFGSAHLLIGASLITLVGQQASAQDLFYDPQAPDTLAAGNWDGNNALDTNWDSQSDLLGANGPFSAGANANFNQLVGGTVTVINNPMPSNILANAPGVAVYNINAGLIGIQGAGNISADTANTLNIASAIDGVAAAQALSLATTGTGVITASGNIGANIGDVTTSGTVTLAGTNTFTGSLTVTGGMTALTGGNAVTNTSALILQGTSTVTLAGAETVGDLTGDAGTNLNNGGNNLTVAQTGDTDFKGIIAGAGGLIKQGGGQLTLSGGNTYAGATDIQAGTIIATTDDALGTAVGGTTVASGATLAIAGAAPVTIADALTITGGGDTANGFSGAIESTGNNTLTGGLTVNSPATVHNTAGTLTLNGNINGGPGGPRVITFQTDAGSLIDVNGSIAFSMDGVIKTGQGTLDLSGVANSYWLAPGELTQIVDGVVIVDNNNNLGFTGGGGASDGVGFNGGAGQAPTLRVVNNNIDFDAANRFFTVNGSLAQFDVSGGLTATVGNNELIFAAQTNTLSQIGAGTLVINAAGSGVGNLATINGTLDAPAGTLNVLGASAGPANLITDCFGMPAAGGTNLLVGGLGSPGGGQTGTINLGVAGNVFDNVEINQTVNGTFDGTLKTTGNLLVTGPGTLQLNGVNSIAGNVHVVDTILNVANAAALGSVGPNYDSGSTVVWGQGTGHPIGGQLSLSNGVTVGELITLAGNARLDNLSGANTITSEVRVARMDPAVAGPQASDSSRIGATAGTLTLGAGITSGTSGTCILAGQSIALNGEATDLGTLIIDGQIQAAINGVSIGNDPAGIVQLNAANLYTGQTLLKGGTLVVGNNAALSTGNLIVNNAATLNAGVAPVALSNDISLNATLTTGNALSANLSLNGTISGPGGITKAGANNTTLGGTNTYAGATTVTGGTLTIAGSINNSITVQVDVGTTLATTGAEKLGDGANLIADGTVNLGGNETVTGLNGAATGIVNVGANTLTAQSGTFAGNLVGAGGQFVKNGGGTLTLSGDNSALTGTTTVNGGILNAANLGSGTVAVNLGGTLTATGNFAATNINVATGGTLNANSLIAAAATVNTSGVVNVNSGPNTIANLNINAASGQVNLLGGDLTTGGLNGIGTINLGANTLSVANGIYGGTINGTGNLTKTGPGLLTLNGSNGYTGATNVNGGTLNALTALSTSAVNIATGATYLNAGGLIDPAVAISNNGTFTLFGDEQGLVYNSNGGLLNGLGKLTAANYNLSNGASTAVGANLGLGTLTINGALPVTLNGTADAGIVNIVTGNLILGSADRLADNAAVTNAAILTLTGNETVGTYESNGTGTLAGAAGVPNPDILTAATYNLNNNSVVDATAGIGEGILTVTGLAGQSVALNGKSSANTVNVNSGGLTLAAGSLVIDPNTVLNPGNRVDVAIAAAGTLTVNGANTVSTLSNSGIVNGNNILTVIDDADGNAATVTTVFNGGTLAANATVNADGGAVLNNGTLINGTLNGDTATNGNVTVGLPGSLGGALNSLTVNSGSVLSLNGFANQNTVGIANNGQIVLGADEVLSDSATVTNAGTLTLFGTMVTPGTEIVNTYVSNGGNLNGNGTLFANLFDLNNGSTIAQGVVLEDLPGGRNVRTSGNVALNGVSNVDLVTIESGTLIGGANADLNYQILEGNGTLALSGATFTNEAGRTINPGLSGINEIGSLTIADNFVNHTGDPLNIPGDTDGVLVFNTNVQLGTVNNCNLDFANRDNLQVLGTTNLGGTITVNELGTGLNRGVSATLINSTGATTVDADLITGDYKATFNDGSLNRNFLVINNDPDNNAVTTDSTVTLLGSGFGDAQGLGNIAGLTANQIAIANAANTNIAGNGDILDTSIGADQIALAIIGTCNTAPGLSINALSPESYAGLVDYGIQVTKSYTTAAMSMPGTSIDGSARSVRIPVGSMSKMADVPAPSIREAHTSVFAGYAHFDTGTESSVNGADYDINSNGGILGIRHQTGAFTIAGFVGIDQGDVDSAFIDTDVDGFLLGAVASYMIKPEMNLMVTGGLTYGNYSYDGTRQSLGGPVTFGADSDVFDIHLGIEGDAYSNDKVRVSPFAQLHYVTAETDSIRENGLPGNPAALLVNGLDEDAFFAQFGVKAEYQVNNKFSLNGNLSYTHNFMDSDRTVSATLGGAQFAVNAPGLGENTFTIGVGAQYQVTEAFRLGVNYRAELSEDADVANGISLGGSYSF